MKIAVLREAGGIGDIVMTEPVVRGLKMKYPAAEVWYVSLGEYEEVVNMFPLGPDVFYKVERSRRRERDAAVDTERWPYLELVADADMVVDLFCPAFRHEKARANLTRLSRVECFCAAAGVEPSAPQVRVVDGERNWAEGFLAAHGWERGQTLVALAPKSCGRRRSWPMGKWVELSEKLLAGGAVPLVLHGYRGAVRDVDGVFATGFPLPKVAGLLSLCSLAVVNDSGILHLASAAGVRTLSLWGSTSPYVTLAMYGNAEYLFKPESDARPQRCKAPCYSIRSACDYDACAEGCRILDAIEVDEVLVKMSRVRHT